MANRAGTRGMCKAVCSAGCAKGFSSLEAFDVAGGEVFGGVCVGGE